MIGKKPYYDHEDAITLLLRALRAQLALEKHANEFETAAPDKLCLGCRRYTTSVLRGAEPAAAIRFACETIRETNEFMRDADSVARWWDTKGLAG